MKKIFNCRFWKYFIITFVIIQLLAIISAVAHYTDQFFIHTTPISFALKFCLIASVLTLPAVFCCAISISSFVTFRYANSQNTPAFFKLLGTGLVFVIPLAVVIYIYDTSIQPRVKAQSLEMYWGIKNDLYPKVIDSKFDRTPNFEDINASVIPKERLQFKFDSLKIEQSKQIIECNKLLELLPSKLATEAYESYRLEQMGVDHRYAETTEASEDSLAYIQQVLLYNQADNLAENSILLGEYQYESYKRNINAICLVLSYLVFATLGYCLRVKSMTKIFGIVAIIIVSFYMLYAVTHLTQEYLKQTIIKVK